MSKEPDGQNRKKEFALAPMLLIMTVVTGAVDAVSILRLGHI